MSGVFVALSLSLDLSAAPLSPSDPSLASNLVTWLADPASNFDDGTWYDLGPNRHKLTTVGGLTDPAIITESPGSGLFSGKSFSSLFFSQSASELLSGPSGASSYADLTAVVVYRATQRDGNLRPFGIGSLNPLSPVPSSLPHMNMGTDPSIRKDNGSLIGHTIAHPLDRVFIRTTVFDSSGSGSIKERFDGSTAYSSNSTHYTVNSGQLFVGDVRNPASGVIPGVVGNAISLNGEGDCIQTDWPGFSGDTPRSVAFWFRIPPGAHSGTEFPAVVGWGSRENRSNGKWKIWFTRNHKDGELLPGISFGADDYYCETPVDDGHWHHLVAIFTGPALSDGSPECSLYLNGNRKPLVHHFGPEGPPESREVQTVTTGPEAHPLSIGFGLRPKVPTLHADLDELQLFEGAIPEQAILDLYEKGHVH
jgi:hypothetical protein